MQVEFWNERPGYPPFNKEASELWKTDKTGMQTCF